MYEVEVELMYLIDCRFLLLERKCLEGGGYMYTDLATIYERAGHIEGRLSLRFLILIMPNDW